MVAELCKPARGSGLTSELSWIGGHFPSGEAASKSLYLALRNIEKDWKMPPITWRQAVNQFAILFGERFTAAIS